MEKKFRVYDLKSKHYLRHAFTDSKGNIYRDADPYGVQMSGKRNIYGVADVIREDYTGLTDSKGVEIYEGDRVRFVAVEDELRGHRTEATGVVEWDSADAGFYILNDSDKWPHVKFWFAENIEVIGNIHQHSNPL